MATTWTFHRAVGSRPSFTDPKEAAVSVEELHGKTVVRIDKGKGPILYVPWENVACVSETREAAPKAKAKAAPKPSAKAPAAKE